MAKLKIAKFMAILPPPDPNFCKNASKTIFLMLKRAREDGGDITNVFKVWYREVCRSICIFDILGSNFRKHRLISRKFYFVFTLCKFTLDAKNIDHVEHTYFAVTHKQFEYGIIYLTPREMNWLKQQKGVLLSIFLMF